MSVHKLSPGSLGVHYAPYEGEAANSIKNRVQRAANSAFKDIKYAWSYAGKAILFVKRDLKVLIARRPGLGKDLNPVINELSLTAPIAISLGLVAFAKEMQEINYSLKVGDFEGARDALMAAGMISADNLDMVITFLGALKGLGQDIYYPGWFSVVGMPAIYALFGLSLVTNGVKIKRSVALVNQLKELEKVPDDKYKEALKKFLERSLGDRRKMVRRTSEVEVKELEKLKVQVSDPMSFTEADKVLSKNLLSNMKTLQKRKIRARIVSITCVLVSIVALTLFSCAVPIFIPFTLLAIVAGVRLCLYTYEDQFMKRDLTFVGDTKETVVQTDSPSTRQV